MARLPQIDAAAAPGRSRELLQAIEAKHGMTPNIAGVIASSPAALEAYVGFASALEGVHDPRLREQIALIVAETNGCSYCLSAHSAAGRLVGLSEEEIAEARAGYSLDARENAALEFARKLVELRGGVADEDVQRLRAAGFTAAEVVELVALVALNLFTNTVGRSLQPDIDFPLVEPGLARAA
jgi:uncharacterized peroxidase-related enzyme